MTERCESIQLGRWWFKPTIQCEGSLCSRQKVQAFILSHTLVCHAEVKVQKCFSFPFWRCIVLGRGHWLGCAICCGRTCRGRSTNFSVFLFFCLCFITSHTVKWSHVPAECCEDGWRETHLLNWHRKLCCWHSLQYYVVSMCLSESDDDLLHFHYFQGMLVSLTASC